MVKLESTNKKSPNVSFRQAIIRGQAPDKGLYFPKTMPKIDDGMLIEFEDMDYPLIASHILSLFLKDEMPQDEIDRVCRQAYDFDVPLEDVNGMDYIMRLDRGPTASFKDFAARSMAGIMQYFLGISGENLIILTATSGDTGSAVANAFNRAKNIRTVVLFPKDEVTLMQRRQMTTLSGNSRAIAVDGKFDDCQALVKRAFSDPELEHLNLSSANSINIGRLIPQSVYYFFAHSRVAKPGEKIIYSVPSGNFGDMMGGMIAWKMGLDIERIIVATNENDNFPKFLMSGQYCPISPSRSCISNAMNVGHPSNLARLFHLFGGWMDESGIIRKMPDLDSMRKILWSVSVTDEQTRQAIKKAYEKHSILLEPHGAVGWKALEDYRSQIDRSTKAVCIETADPAKFPQEIVSVLGFEPKIPESLKGLSEIDERYDSIPKKYEDLKSCLKCMR